MMTRKNFEAIATDFAVQMNCIEAELILAERIEDVAARETIKRQWNCAAGNVERLAYSMAATFRIENPRFDSARFLRACGVKS